MMIDDVLFSERKQHKRTAFIKWDIQLYLGHEQLNQTKIVNVV